MHSFVVLLHYPMLDRTGKEVATAVTNLDIHDIARSCKTFGITKYFIVHPDDQQHALVKGILDHWHAEVSKVYHPWRAQALADVQLCHTLEEAVNEATKLAGGVRPTLIMPDAREIPEALGYDELRTKIESGALATPMIIFGTGFGIAPRYFETMDIIAKPILGPMRDGKRYNHLSVRGAAAIVLDRLFGA